MPQGVAVRVRARALSLCHRSSAVEHAIRNREVVGSIPTGGSRQARLCGRNSVGRMPASQAGRRRFESGRPLFGDTKLRLVSPTPGASRIRRFACVTAATVARAFARLHRVAPESSRAATLATPARNRVLADPLEDLAKIDHDLALSRCRLPGERIRHSDAVRAFTRPNLDRAVVRIGDPILLDS